MPPTTRTAKRKADELEAERLDTELKLANRQKWVETDVYRFLFAILPVLQGTLKQDKYMLLLRTHKICRDYLWNVLYTKPNAKDVFVNTILPTLGRFPIHKSDMSKYCNGSLTWNYVKEEYSGLYTDHEGMIHIDVYTIGVSEIYISLLEWHTFPNLFCHEKRHNWRVRVRINEKPRLIPPVEFKSFYSVNKNVEYPTECWDELWALLSSDRLLQLTPV